MTNKQLLKRLQYQQNKIINVEGYSFYISQTNFKAGIYFNARISDCNDNYIVIFHELFYVEDALLGIKLEKLKDIVNDLLNNKTIRN